MTGNRGKPTRERPTDDACERRIVARVRPDGIPRALTPRCSTSAPITGSHFRGHAYDPHDHDDMLVGYTEQGVQRFQCHRSLHTCVPGRAILIEPGALHDGHAPEAGGFTYAMCNCRKTGLSMRRAN
ncbi:hypothetical protein PPGU19_091940 (plasmid) [Paraburkholderia sp. PGU19]|nr:hypothetical protein PPGU19_091940 [Paraburkholderia sp. PGU19]